MTNEYKKEIFKAFFKHKINYIIDNDLPNHEIDQLREKYYKNFKEKITSIEIVDIK